MKINEFKAAVLEKNAAAEAAKKRNRVNIATLQTANFDIRDHPQQTSKYNITYDFYDDVDNFDKTPTVPKSIKTIMPKMLNWKKTKADYYIWLDGSTKLTDAYSVETMIDFFSTTNTGIMLYPHPTRANIIEEVDYIETEINNGNQELANIYNIDTLKSSVKSYIDDFPELKTYPLFDTRAFLYDGELVDDIRRSGNFFLNWFTQTIIGGMNDTISLIYTLRYRNLLRVVFPEHISKGTYIQTRQ